MKFSVFASILLQIILSLGVTSFAVDSEICDCNSTKTSNYHKIFDVNFIFELTKIARDIGLASEVCARDLVLINEGIRRKAVWAFKIADASSKPSPGFLIGNNFWLGSEVQCKYAGNKINVKFSDRFPRTTLDGVLDEIAPFDVGMRIAYVDHESPLQVQPKMMGANTLNLGLCLPNSCHNKDVKLLLQNLFSQIDNDSQLKMKPRVIEVKKIGFDPQFFLKKNVLALTASFIFAWVIKSLAKNMEISLRRDENNNSTVEEQIKLSRRQKILRCFNFDENKKILKEEGGSCVKSISGMRAISCYVIAMSHICTFMSFTLTDKITYYDQSDSIGGMFMTSVALLVDGFFAISGYLAATSFLRNSKQVETIKKNTLLQNAKLYFQLILQRYIRLTPLFVFTILVTTVVTGLVHQISPYQQFFRDDQLCSEFSWRNLLYIHNLFHNKEMCLGWSWSMACEMQFFVVTTLVLMIYVRNPKLGGNILKYSLVFFTALSLFIHINVKTEYLLDVMYDLMTIIYTKPWVRIGPYLMGTLTAIFLKNNEGNLNISRKTAKKCFYACWIIFGVIIAGQLDRSLSSPVMSLLLVLAHLEVGFVFCWMIIADISGHQNSFVKFLSRRLFQRFAKFSYAFYLLAPTVAILIYGFKKGGSSFDLVEMVIMSNVVLSINSKLAKYATLHFEIPFNNLSKLVFKKNEVVKKIE